MNPADYNGVTCLHLASSNGHFNMCQHIIGNVDNKNPEDINRITPLDIAASKGYFQICKLIVDNVENKNPAKINGATPLHTAANYGHFEICKLIVDNVDGMAKNPADINGYTPLHIAAKKGHFEIWGLIADEHGRRKSLIISSILLLMFGLLTAFSTSYLWLVVLRFLCGCCISCMPQCVTLLLEYLPSRDRGKANLVMAMTWAFGATFTILLENSSNDKEFLPK